MSLSERLKTEFARNKKKSAILGIMCLVAMYYWIPLFGKWFGGDEAHADDAEIDPSEPPAFVVTESNISKQPEQSASVWQSGLTWSKLAALRGKDPLMMPAILPSDARNPFELFLPPKNANTVDVERQPGQNPPTAQQNAANRPLPETLEKYNLKLTNVFLGRRFRAATINGQTYHEDDTISLDGFDFTLTQLHAGHVVLSLGRKTYELQVAKRELKSGNVVILHKPETNN